MDRRSYALIAGAAAVLTFFALHCRKDDSGPTAPSSGDVRNAASVVVRTDQEGTVTHAAGSSIRIPRWAVPLQEDSTTGEMLFTIDVGTPEQFGVPRTPPAGWQLSTDVHSMGPEGFVFAEPVVASIPLPQELNTAQYDVCMYDYDRATSSWKAVGGRFAADGRSLEVDAIHLCANMLLSTRWTEKATGAIQFSTIPRYSFKACIETYTLRYPEYDVNFVAAGRIRSIDRRDASTTPPDGFVYWRLPQGTYTFSVMVYYHDPATPMERPTYLGYFQKTIVINQPHWNWQGGPQAPDYEYAVFFGDLTPYTNPANLTPGTPGCWAAPTPSVGIGTLNVRLEWSDSADLDLHVYDPCGKHIYYARRADTCQNSVGRLDLDNMCGNLVIGRPENIFWRSSPPRGAYTVSVRYYADCAQAGTVFFTVRWTLNGTTYARSGSLAPLDTFLVAQFSY